MAKSRSLLARMSSIRFRLIVVPLLLLSLAIGVLGIVIFGFVRTAMLKGMQGLGMDLAAQAVHRLADNAAALNEVESALAHILLLIGRIAAANGDSISNDYLARLADTMSVDVIYWYNRNLEIVASSTGEHLGWVAPADHPVAQFFASGQNELVEDVRQDTTSDQYYKYAYVRSPQGEMVQVGIAADIVNQLKEQFSIQYLVEELASTEAIVYALFVDRNQIALAHSSPDRIGMLFEDEGSAAAAVRGESHTTEYYYEPTGERAFDVSLPVVLDGEHIGALKIGLSLEEVLTGIRNTLILIVVIGGAAFVVIGSLLVRLSMQIVNSLHTTQTHLGSLAQGDFTQEVPANYLARTDEFGEMARALANMQTSVKDVLDEVTEASLEIAGTSQELSASTEETSASIEQVASTSNQFASTVQQMSDNSQAMVQSANQICSATTRGSGAVQEIVTSTAELKSVILGMADAVESLGQQSREISEIVEVITSIAEQTNLLALNAAIEAARAGEHGRGFAVVAEEVRKLAEQSAASTTRIIELIHSMQEETQRTISGINHTAEQAERNAAVVDETGRLMQEIIASVDSIIAQIDELSEGIKEINFGSQELASTTEEQSASIETIATSAQNLSDMAGHLQGLVGKFRLR